MGEKRNITVYGLLAAVLLLLCVWQILEHRRVRESAREALLNRARDISNSLGVVIRSQRPFFGILPAERLESALSELVQSKELLSIALLNSAGEVVASAGQPISEPMQDLETLGNRWSDRAVTFFNLVDLGAGPDDRLTTQPAPIVIRRPERGPDNGPDREPDREPDRGGPDRRSERKPSDMGRPGSNSSDDATTETRGPGRPRGRDRDPRRGEREDRPERVERGDRDERDSSRRGGRRDRPFHRPPWLSEQEYQELLEKAGLHGFVLRMSTAVYQSNVSQDFLVRITVMALSLAAVLGLGLAWRVADRSNRLQMRLLRAAELNIHLQEMNIAAAGLAHETRNPLNVVRGLAQMIARESSVPPDVRDKSREISAEVDRVTGRLNEFINYSKPPQPRLAPTNLQGVVRDVVRAMESDMEDKALRFELKGSEPTVEADESLLRQVIFNLMMNAVQAVGREGCVEVCIENGSRGEASFEVRDNGPGVPPDIREEIFSPYFTTRKEGSGLGLAIVRQIVLAHHWEVDYLPGRNGGAVFRVTGLKTT